MTDSPLSISPGTIKSVHTRRFGPGDIAAFLALPRTEHLEVTPEIVRYRAERLLGNRQAEAPRTALREARVDLGRRKKAGHFVEEKVFTLSLVFSDPKLPERIPIADLGTVEAALSTGRAVAEALTIPLIDASKGRAAPETRAY